MTFTTTQFCQIVVSSSLMGGVVGWIIGYWRGSTMGLKIGLKALDEYHNHTMKAIGDL